MDADGVLSFTIDARERVGHCRVAVQGAHSGVQRCARFHERSRIYVNHSDEVWAIRQVVENWVVWRDSADWERFRTVWHDDGRMMATWFQGTADEFIRVSKEGFERGVNILHFLGGHSADVTGNRAMPGAWLSLAGLLGLTATLVLTSQRASRASEFAASKA